MICSERDRVEIDHGADQLCLQVGIAGEKEAVAVAEAGELAMQDRLREWAEAAARQMILGNHGDPAIEVFHSSVGIGESGLQGDVGRELTEIVQRPEIVGLPHQPVVVEQAQVAAALDVERREIGAACARRTEADVAEAVHNVRVVFLGGLRREAFEDQIDALAGRSIR